jgi:hypothetical protein
VAERTRIQNRLRWHLHDLDPALDEQARRLERSIRRLEKVAGGEPTRNVHDCFNWEPVKPPADYQPPEGFTPIPDQSPGEPAYEPPPDFCDTHDCIPNFENGTGYPTQCEDGTWSGSGGRPGACSWHGGVCP